MKKKNSKILGVSLICSIILFSTYIMPISLGTPLEINPVIRDTPNVNGEIDIDEWNDILFDTAYLKTKPEEPLGLETSIKAIQDKNDLYMLFQFEINNGSQGPNGFLAILISNANSYTQYDFVDAKIVNISSYTDYTYTDYNIDYTTNNFTRDQLIDGNGAGKIEKQSDVNIFTYEFHIPLDIDKSEDAYLEYGKSYKFNISQGENPSYPEGIIRSDNITINIKNPPETPFFNIEILMIAFSITIFSLNGAFIGFYIYRIILLKKKMKRIR
ncbi:MAG: hypothetical protein JXA99_00660 [Candidatus Lokiarchaeota archaeon]|nr:hypothetical protein [Candidatus Lokiarchaeota archaeon]